jgi:hypothetical protein
VDGGDGEVASAPVLVEVLVTTDPLVLPDALGRRPGAGIGLCPHGSHFLYCRHPALPYRAQLFNSFFSTSFELRVIGRRQTGRDCCGGFEERSFSELGIERLLKSSPHTLVFLSRPMPSVVRPMLSRAYPARPSAKRVVVRPPHPVFCRSKSSPRNEHREGRGFFISEVIFKVFR